MDNYPENNPAFPDPTRPDLKPVDPRASASPTNDFYIAGSIDNESVFNVGTGQSERSRF